MQIQKVKEWKLINDWVKTQGSSVMEILQRELSVEIDLVAGENGNKYSVTIIYNQMTAWFEYDPYVQSGFIGQVDKLLIIASHILINNPHLNYEPKYISEKIIDYAIS